MTLIRMLASVEPMTVPDAAQDADTAHHRRGDDLQLEARACAAWIWLNWVANRTLQMPVKTPFRMKVVMRMRRVSMPESRAASALPPTAYCDRPVRL